MTEIRPKRLFFMLINAYPPTGDSIQRISINSRGLVFSTAERNTGMIFKLVNNKLFPLGRDLELSFGPLSFHA